MISPSSDINQIEASFNNNLKLQRHRSKTLQPLLSKRTARVWFLRNKDFYFDGFSLAISKREFRSFNELFQVLTKILKRYVKLSSPIVGIEHFYKRTLVDINQFHDNDLFVCMCLNETLTMGRYRIKSEYFRMLRMKKDQMQLYSNASSDSAVFELEPSQKMQITYITKNDLSESIVKYIDVGRKIYSSQFAVIFEGSNRMNNKDLYAIKVIKPFSKKCISKPGVYELEILRQLQIHDNIIKLAYTVEGGIFSYMVQELSKCDLCKLLQDRGPLPEQLVSEIMVDIAAGLEHIHVNFIIHRDIKPDNLLVHVRQTNPEILQIKIGDFGLSTYYYGEPMMLFCGTARYVAPEVIAIKGYDFAFDCWSLGVTLFNLLTGRFPFSTLDSTFDEIKYLILKKKHIFPDPYDKRLSLEAKQLVDLLLEKDQKRRICITQVRNHPFLYHRNHGN